MSYFNLQQIGSTITIKNKKRISLIVPYKSTQLVIFYQDCTYDHRQVVDNKILHQGKLKFIPLEYVKTQFQWGNPQMNIYQNCEPTNGYICLIGRKDDTVHFGILNVQSKLYKPYDAQFYQTKIESEPPKYHLISNTTSKQPFLIEVSPNIQSGIMIKCFDFKRRQWLNNILYLGSKYLSSDFVSVPQGIFGPQNTSCFCLIANGEKSQSLYISCVTITESKTKSETAQNYSLVPSSEQPSFISVDPKQIMGFVFNKEIKYYRNFTFIGAHLQSSGNLFLVGNSLLFETPEKRKSLCQASLMYINLVNLASNFDSEYRFLDVKNSKLQREITLRDFLGYFEQSLLFILENPSRCTIHRFTPSRMLSKQPHYDEQIYQFPKLIRLQSSFDHNSLISYQLVCEQFFEKIKDSPSVIKLDRLMKVSKKIYYNEILTKICQGAGNNEQFFKTILSLL